MSKAKSLIVACAVLVAAIGAIAVPANAQPMMMHRHHGMMMHHHHPMMMHRHPMMMRHHMMHRHM